VGKEILGMGFFEFIKANKPLIGSKRYALNQLRGYLSKEDLRKIKRAVNFGLVSFTNATLGLSKEIAEDKLFPSLSPLKTDKKTREFVDRMNEKIEESVFESLFKDFSKRAWEVIPKYVAYKLHGLELIKQAITLQMFSQGVHILLLGDPGTGKTEFLQSVEKLYPKTSFGLGSGTTGVGLAVTVRGKQVKPGLLPMANNGICCIDELNLMKKEDYASLYSAMEKGFITYDKGGSHYRFEANVRILATANPIGDKFRGTTRDAIVRQLPFESALLSRFTLVFLIRKPDLKTFIKIASDIVTKSKKQLKEGDVEFIRRYISFAEGLEVEFPKRFKAKVMAFSKEIKLAEDKFFFEVSPRLIHGLMNLSIAHARLHLRREVNSDDIAKARSIILSALENKVS